MIALHPAAQSFIDMQVSPETKKAYGKDLRCWFDWFYSEERDWHVDTIVAFKSWLEAHRAPAGASRVFTTARTYHRWLQQRGLLAVNHFEHVKRPKRITNQVPEVPTEMDVAALLHAARSAPQPHWYCITTLLLNGLRASEAANLTVEDILLDTQVPTIRVLGKGMKERLVPLGDEAAGALIEWLNVRHRLGKKSRYLFDDDGAPLSLRQVEHIVYKSAERAGVKTHPHALRHHYATRLIRAGVDVLHVSKLLGHERADTTQVYVQLDLTDLTRASRRDPRNNHNVLQARRQAQIA